MFLYLGISNQRVVTFLYRELPKRSMIYDEKCLALMFYTMLGLKRNSQINVEEILLEKILEILNGRVRYIEVEKSFGGYEVIFGESKLKKYDHISLGKYFGYHPLEIATFNKIGKVVTYYIILKNIKKILGISNDFEELLKNLGNYAYIFAWAIDHLPYPFLKREYVEFCKERSERIREISKGFWKYLVYSFLKRIVMSSKVNLFHGKTIYEIERSAVRRLESLLETFQLKRILNEFIRILEYLNNLPMKYDTKVVFLRPNSLILLPIKENPAKRKLKTVLHTLAQKILNY